MFRKVLDGIYIRSSIHTDYDLHKMEGILQKHEKLIVIKRPLSGIKY